MQHFSEARNWRTILSKEIFDSMWIVIHLAIINSGCHLHGCRRVVQLVGSSSVSAQVSICGERLVTQAACKRSVICMSQEMPFQRAIRAQLACTEATNVLAILSTLIVLVLLQVGGEFSSRRDVCSGTKGTVEELDTIFVCVGLELDILSIPLF